MNRWMRKTRHWTYDIPSRIRLGIASRKTDKIYAKDPTYEGFDAPIWVDAVMREEDIKWKRGKKRRDKYISKYGYDAYIIKKFGLK